MSVLAEKLAYFKGKQEEILAKQRELHNLVEQYRAEVKATFGITDGDTLHVLGLIEALHKAKELG